MNETFDDALGETASRLFADHVTPELLGAAERGAWPSALWAAVEDVGLTKALVPEEAGGFGIPLADALRLLRAAGAAALPLPLAETMLAGWLVAGAGLPCPEGPLTIASGDGIKLSRNTGGWHVSGRAARVAWGRDAAAVAVLATLEGQSYVVLLQRDDLRFDASTNVAGEPRDMLHVDADIADEAVALAASGVGPAQVRAAGAATRALLMAGALERVSMMTVRYATERKQFGKPIGRFQAVQQNLAVLAAEAAAAIAASDLAAEGLAEGVRLPAIAAGKARTGEAAGIGAAIAHQVHGAIGFTYEHSLHFLTKRLWSWRDEYGTESEWNLLLGRYAANAGADRLWSEITAI